MAIDFQQLPHLGIRALIPYKPGKSKEELTKEKGLTDIIKLASNENPLGCSPMALSALRSMSPHLLATYPSPLNHPIMPKLAAKLNVDVQQLFVSNGSDPIFGLLLNCFALHTNKHLLTHDYAFSTYAIQARTLNIPVVQVGVQPDWQVNVKALINACSKDTGLIILANPNNPTGLLIPPKDLKTLLENIPPSTILVVDEAYYEFAASQLEENSLEWLSQHPNLVITRTFSKIYGLAGIRLGYAIANPSIINLLQRVQLPFTVNQVALNAAHAALDDDEFLQLSLSTNRQGIEQVREGLKALKIQYLPTACNFFCFDCGEDSLKLYNYLLNKGIIVRPLHPYQMNQHIRVSIGTQEQNNRFLKALGEYYQAP